MKFHWILFFLIVWTPAAQGADGENSRDVAVSALYTADFWRNADGGVQRGGRAFDDLLVTVTADLEKSGAGSDGELLVSVLNTHSADFSNRFVGAAQTLSNIETVTALRLFEAWYEQSIGPLSLRTGLYNLNSEFDAIDTAGVFLNASHGIGQDYSQTGLAGPSIFPVTSLAARVQWQVSDRLTARGAVLDAVPGDPANPKRTVIDLSSREGALLAGEAEGKLGAAVLAAGVWDYTAGFNAFDGRHRRGNWGGYVEAEGPLGLRAADVAVFARAGLAAARFNRFGTYASVGVVMNGPIPSRPSDTLGFAVASAGTGLAYRLAQAADGFATARRETVLEGTYRLQFRPWAALQPDVQYVISPSANPRLRNALAVGVRLQLFAAAGL